MMRMAWILLLAAMGTARADGLPEKLDRLVIPHMEFKEAPVAQVLAWLNDAAREADTNSAPEERGINLLFQADSGKEMPTVTMRLRHIRVRDALAYITELTGLQYRVEDRIVLVSPRTPAPPPGPFQVNIQVDLIEVLDRDAAQRFRFNTLSADELRALPASACRQRGTLAVITKAGANAEAKSQAGALDSEKERSFSMVLNCTPSVGPDAATIEMVMLWQARRPLPGQPGRVAEMTLCQNLALRSGGAVVLPVQIPEDAAADRTSETKPHYLLVSARLLDPAGRPVRPAGPLPPPPGPPRARP